jgi:hypothetical protein
MNGMETNVLSELERSILHGLLLEWESVLAFVPHRLRPGMIPPTFSLKNSEKSLAHWNPEKRDISFSRNFVLNHPWDAVKEVLVHEMAHQYASEILRAVNEPPHGPSFHKACLILKANPEASGTYPALHERLATNDLTDRDRLILKVKKLLALGKSLNAHEAQAAAAKAHSLIVKYNLDMIENDDERNFVSVFAGLPSLRHNREDYRLAHLLTEHYFVYGIWVPAFVKEKGKMGRVFEITGTPENVKIAAYVHGFLTRHMESSWVAFNKGRKLGRMRQSDYSLGLILGFHDRLSREKDAAPPSARSATGSRALVIRDPKLDDYVSFRYPRVHHVRGKARSHDASLIDAGKDEGRKLVLNKAMETGHSGGVSRLTLRTDT